MTAEIVMVWKYCEEIFYFLAPLRLVCFVRMPDVMRQYYSSTRTSLEETMKIIQVPVNFTRHHTKIV